MPDDNCCYLCNECPQTFASLLELQSHLQVDHQTGNSTTSTTASSRQQQQEMSGAKNIFAVSSTQNADKRLEHSMEEVENGDEDEEMDMTMDESTTHQGEDEHLCGANSPTSSDFSVDESMNEHGLMNGPAAGDGSYPCLKCTRMFSDRDQLNIHYTHTHRDKPQYVCEVCEKVFAVKRELSTHLRIHSGEQPHKCGQCGKEFGTRQLLKKHNMWHTGERSHVCDNCGKAFFQKGHLTQHLMIHKGGRPHQCTLCEKTFIFKFDLNRHMKIHAERGHSCPKCGKCFPKECALEEHVSKCKRTPSRPQSSRHPANCSPHSLSDGSPISGQDAQSSSSSPRPSIRPQYSHPSASSLVTSSQSPHIPFSTPQCSIKMEPPNPSAFFPTPTTNPLGMFSEEDVSKVAKVLFAQQQQAQTAQNLANFFAVNGLQKHAVPAMPAQSHFFGSSPASLAPKMGVEQGQQQWNCFLCNKQMPNQAAYMLHWSTVHMRGAHAEDVNNNSEIKSSAKMVVSSPFLHPNKSSVDLSSDCYSATNSSCASSPQKISPVGPVSTTPMAHPRQQQAEPVPFLSTPCVNCENSRQRQLEAEKELAKTRLELDRLKQVMEKVGSIANSLFNSCGNTNNPELEKLWMLRAK